MDQEPEQKQKLYTMIVNGEWLIHPHDHFNETLRGKPVEMNGILIRDILRRMLNENSPNEVGEHFQVFRVE